MAVDPLTIDLAGRVAIVTGGAAGIGRGIATQLARCGADVVIADVDGDGAQRTANEVEAMERRSLALACDVMDTEQVRSTIARTEAYFGRLDILVNNAGGVKFRPFLEQNERSWRRHIDLNLSSVFEATSAAAPLMIRGRQGGSIVNLASIEATRAAPGYAVYAASKAAVLSFTRSMALELADDGIRVNAISPDWTRTPGNLGLTGAQRTDELPEPSPKEQELAERYVPLRRQGTIEECGRLVAFLCSPHAAYITGVNVPVDGGTWASSGWLRSSSSGWTVWGE